MTNRLRKVLHLNFFSKKLTEICQNLTDAVNQKKFNCQLRNGTKFN